jgi:enamine deaminase RidA (YjgF/YER057c/UK114 family)
VAPPEPIVPEGTELQYERFHYAPAVRVGDLVLASGVIGLEADGSCAEDPEQQFETAFANLGHLLAGCGGSLADIVEMTSYHTALQAQMRTFMAVRDRHLSPPWPAWTAIGTTELAYPGALVEIRVTAHIPAT